MSSNVGQARAALGARLRDLRRDARLSGKDMAQQCGWHPSKVSRIELGRQQPSEDDLLMWCRAANAASAYDDLVATLRNTQSMYLEWRRVVASGRSHRQRQSLQIEDRAQHVRWYENAVVPGLLQTREYARAVLAECRRLIAGGRDDIDEAVAVRMTRQRILHTGSRRFAFIVAEAALHQVVGTRAVMANQMRRLIEEASNPRVDFGVIPLPANSLLGSHGFAMFDRESVMVETVSAELTITRPSEIAVYDHTFGAMHEIALHGSAAVEVLTRLAAEHERLSDHAREDQ
ncbi:helix-turn-helix domain-containing protein [Nocardia rhamnosiphila]